MKEPATKVKLAREAAGFSQLDVALYIEKPTSFVSLMERALVTPSPAIAEKIARVLNLAVEDLFPAGKSKEE